MNDELKTLIEIVDALAAKLARDRPKDETLQIIAARARDLRNNNGATKQDAARLSI